MLKIPFSGNNCVILTFNCCALRLKRYLFLFIVLFCLIFETNGQNVSLYNQFNGRYDFTFIGNTLNEFPNGLGFPCELLPNSDATLNLGPNDVIQKAYLYWSGSGTGDFDVKLNGIDISSQRNFSAIQTLNGNPPINRPFFSAFADVTAILQTTGNGIYTLSDLDLSAVFLNDEGYCQNGTNFAGWAIVVVYENPSLLLNQLNVYDGLETLSSPNPPTAVDQLVINLGNLNVLDNSGAKVGFVAFEGDDYIQEQETLTINNHPLGDALNPTNNAFNGTNNITGNAQLWNMDLDIYSIQNYIAIGNTSATIRMTTAQDYVMISTIVTKLNSQLPDATISLNSVEKDCNSRVIAVNYTVSNLDSTDVLPALTPISFYINGVLVASDYTTLPIPIGGSMNYQLLITIPNAVPLDFVLTAVVDDKGDGSGVVTELIETNNTASIAVSLWVSPTFNPLQALVSCNEGFTRGTFDFSSYVDLVQTNPADVVHFYETSEDAANAVNPILNTTNYVAVPTPKEIFVRVDNEHCFAVTSFLLKTRNCPPTVYNYISVNHDTHNDTFTIDGLRNIFLNFKIEIYNRWGRLVWTGNQDTADWNGHVGNGFYDDRATDGTYFYLLFLDDPDYPEPMKGFLYLNH